MGDLLTAENLFTLLMLILLQAVLGFDNLLYISMESKRVTPDRQSYVRRVGVSVAIGLRLVLLFVVVAAIDAFKDPFWTAHLGKVFEIRLTGHAVIVLIGGAFILYTAVKEIFHMLVPDDMEHGAGNGTRSVGGAIFWIVLMNLVFSFDSILSALALTQVFTVMAVAIVISGILMVWLADHVAVFLQKNRMWEVLGLFILLIVGVMLLSEGGHLAHLHFFGFPVEPMSKTTFYFVIAVLVVVDIVQGRYQRKLAAKRAAAVAAPAA